MLVSIGDGSIVHTSIFYVDLQVLCKDVVGTNLIHGLGLSPFLSFPIQVVASFYVYLVLLNRSNAQGVDTVSLVAGVSSIPTL